MQMTLETFLETHVNHRLSQREAEIAKYRMLDIYGLGSNEMTFRELAEARGVSAARIRQITLKAKRKVQYAIHLASQRMQDPHVVVKYVPDVMMELGNLPMRVKHVYDLGHISVRTHNCLLLTGLMVLDNLLEKTRADLLRAPNFGMKSLLELEALLHRNGLALKDRKKPASKS